MQFMSKQSNQNVGYDKQSVTNCKQYKLYIYTSIEIITIFILSL